MNEISEAKAASASDPKPVDDNSRTEAGPSRLGYGARPKARKDKIERWLESYSGESSLTPPMVARDYIRGTQRHITDYFTPADFAAIDDPELLRDLSYLLAPPQIDYEPVVPVDFTRPFWGLSAERTQFFYAEEEDPCIPINPTVQANVERYHKLKHQGVHFNEVLMQNRSFKNPHVYSQLVEHLGIDETRSNLPALDTGRIEEGWRRVFPFTEEQLIEGDPIAVTERQEKAAKEKRKGKRSIDFVSTSSSNPSAADKVAAWTSKQAKHGHSSLASSSRGAQSHRGSTSQLPSIAGHRSSSSRNSNGQRRP